MNTPIFTLKERYFNEVTLQIIESLLNESLDQYVCHPCYPIFHQRLFNNITRSVSKLETLCQNYVHSLPVSDDSRRILESIYNIYVTPWKELWSTTLNEIVKES